MDWSDPELLGFKPAVECVNPEYTGYLKEPLNPEDKGPAKPWFDSFPEFCTPRKWAVHESLNFGQVILSEKSWLIDRFYQLNVNSGRSTISWQS